MTELEKEEIKKQVLESRAKLTDMYFVEAPNIEGTEADFRSYFDRLLVASNNSIYLVDAVYSRLKLGTGDNQKRVDEFYQKWIKQYKSSYVDESYVEDNYAN